MRSAGFVFSKKGSVYRFVCVFLLGVFYTSPQTASMHAQSPASVSIRDDLARPLEIADSSAGSDATVETKSQIGEQSETLLKMARDLQKEVNRTTDTKISAAALRKADQVEKFEKDLTTTAHETARR